MQPDCEKAATVINVSAKYQERDVQLSLFKEKNPLLLENRIPSSSGRE